MRKTILPVMTAAALLASAPSYAQMRMYPDPFDTFFDTMAFQPHRFNFQQNVQPRMDVVDEADKIVVKAELPGIDEKDVSLSLENGVLTLSGERKQQTEEQNANYYLKETSSGAFSRSIRLPQNIDEAKVDAVFERGVLTITVPKIEVKEETAKKIPIKMKD